MSGPITYKVKCERTGRVYLSRPTRERPTHCVKHTHESVPDCNVSIFEPNATCAAASGAAACGCKREEEEGRWRGPRGDKGEPGCGATGQQGPRGEPGYGIDISRVFDSEQAVLDDDCDCRDGKFAIIDTGDANDSAHGRVYICSGGEWHFMFDVTCCHELMRGPAGPRGEGGPDGCIGPRGLGGPQGRDGVQGQRGPNGGKGPKGDTGKGGTQGKSGEEGFAGGAGVQGREGQRGRGVQGRMGEKGQTGDKGKQGPEGPNGLPCTERGPQGEKGEKGEKGDRGYRGCGGPQGRPIKGPQGPAGQFEANHTFECVTLDTLKFSSCDRPAANPVKKQLYMDDACNLWVWCGTEWRALAFVA